MRRLLPVLTIFAFSGGCDRSSGREVIKVAGCALEDEKLSVAFRSPQKAKAYLERLGERLEDGEAKAIEAAADLVARLAECVPE